MANPKVFQMSRRALLGAGLFTGASILLKACSGGSSSDPSAADGSAADSGTPKEIVVGGAAGMTSYLTEDIFPKFEQKYNCKVLFEGTKSMVNLEKMQSNQANPVMSVVLMDDPVMMIALEEGLIEPLTPEEVPNLSQIKDQAIAQDGAWANYQQPWAGVAYNTQQKEGVASWEELWAPENKGRVIIPSMQNTEGLWTFIMAAHLETGKPLQEAQYEVDAAFKKLQELKPNLLTVYTNAPQAINLLAQGEAWMIGGQFSAYTLLQKAEGSPIDLAAPEEGAFAMPSGIARVVDGPEPELAFALINEFLGAEYQSVLAEKVFVLPTNAEATVPAALETPEELFLPDWSFVAENRNDWIERWNREMSV